MHDVMPWGLVSVCGHVWSRVVACGRVCCRVLPCVLMCAGNEVSPPGATLPGGVVSPGRAGPPSVDWRVDVELGARKRGEFMSNPSDRVVGVAMGKVRWHSLQRRYGCCATCIPPDFFPFYIICNPSSLRSRSQPTHPPLNPALPPGMQS
jgi:hypothetical protein